MRKIYAFVLCMIIGLGLKAQDPQFSQNFATPLYLNPAFTGANSYQRIILNYRNQWPAAVSNAFVSYVFSYDYNWSEYNSGLGLFVIRDRAGVSALTYTNVGGLYSYEAKLSSAWSFRAGFHFSYTIKDVDYSRLLFNDQIYRDGGVSFDANSFQKVEYPDFAVGGMFYNKNAFIGFASHHLTEPDESFIGQESKLPRKYSLHAGYRFDLPSRGREKSILPSFNYKQQGNFDQMDLGCYYNHEPVVLGVWYRGVPVPGLNSDKIFNNDAIVVLLGYAVNDQPLHIGYSYDVTVSGLFSKSGGSHEISLIYEFGKSASGRGSGSKYNRKPIPCAKF